MKRQPRVGERVTLNTPDNPTADGKAATVSAVEEWGCHLTTAFGSGSFRALWSEMLPPGPTPAALANGKARAAGYSGDSCPNCQGGRMVRSGTCATCQDCGTTSGCS